MNFDGNKVFNDMLAAMQVSLNDDWQVASGYVQQILSQHKQMLVDLAQLRVEGEISEQELQAELLDEQHTLSAELLALQVVGKASAQRAAHAAMDVLSQAVKAAIL